MKVRGRIAATERKAALTLLLGHQDMGMTWQDWTPKKQSQRSFPLGRCNPAPNLHTQPGDTNHTTVNLSVDSAATDADFRGDTVCNGRVGFHCVDKVRCGPQEAKSAQLSARSLQSGPEPSYTTGRHESYHCEQPLLQGSGPDCSDRAESCADFAS
jgi:hypothetical protein